MNNKQMEVTVNLTNQKEKIKDFVLGLGVDDVGIAAVSSYNSPMSPKMESIFPEAKSMIVLVYKETSNCDSPNKQIAINGRLDLIEFSRSCNYRLARFLEREYDARAMTVPYSFPIDMSKKGIADVSLRHAAIAAGLGSFGRHNLVVHPKYGVRVIFGAVLCDLDVPPDPPVKEDLCNRCNVCVASCPVGALDEEGKTDIAKCVAHIQPHGLRGTISFWHKFVDSSPKEQKEMFLDDSFLNLYHTGIVPYMYVCFSCRNACPVGRSKR
jgi:epoxyqueuosine reductase